MRRRRFALLVIAGALAWSASAGADSTPIGPLPKGAISTIATHPGALVAVAVPRPSASSGLVWRIARPYDAKIVRELSEADVGSSVVLVFKIVGSGRTSIILAQTRGDTSSRALKSATTKIVST